MRTMISLRDDQRERLVEVASRRGEKGFSHLIEEAVDCFLAEEDRRLDAIENVFRSMGEASVPGGRGEPQR